MNTGKYTSLFLDRDGVINHRLPGAYVRRWEKFRFLPGVLQALSRLASLFDHILIVTNQQGIGKQLMSENDLHIVHNRMLREITWAGGRIDGVYFCPDLKTKPGNCRKPAPAMARQAKKDYPDIVFDHSVMVGDSLSDMVFGKVLGMYTVLIETNREEIEALEEQPDLVDDRFPSLLAFTERWEVGR